MLLDEGGVIHLDEEQAREPFRENGFRQDSQDVQDKQDTESTFMGSRTLLPIL